MESDAMRRRSPGWVRVMAKGELHGLALRLRRAFWEGTSTSQQDWLYEAVVSELEYRHRHDKPMERCMCELCCQPFPWDQGELPY